MNWFDPFIPSDKPRISVYDVMGGRREVYFSYPPGFRGPTKIGHHLWGLSLKVTW